ncbi:hypothetical protein BRADI_5g03036v3 [Brachypodium distachyon]|uniref:Uncharacterized protein n=1 Tax=Brachypodium distachyon TaxID=15368 RepID=A0A2K2CF57_BRADI|nr:hypothetical protein BRADI_5g03036v3 [Brachypodium distachyon]
MSLLRREEGAGEPAATPPPQSNPAVRLLPLPALPATPTLPAFFPEEDDAGKEPPGKIIFWPMCNLNFAFYMELMQFWPVCSHTLHFV